MNIVGDFKQGVCYDWGMDGKLDGMTVSNAQGGVFEIRFEWERGRPAGWNVGDPFQNFEPYFQVFQRDSWRPWLVAGALGGKPGPRGTPPDFTFSYAYDALGRPVSRSGDAFAYDARGEVTNATISSAAYRYAYDANRRHSPPFRNHAGVLPMNASRFRFLCNPSRKIVSTALPRCAAVALLCGFAMAFPSVVRAQGDCPPLGVTWRAGLLQSQWRGTGEDGWDLTTPLPLENPERTPGAFMADKRLGYPPDFTTGFPNPWTGLETRFSTSENMLGYSGQIRLKGGAPCVFGRNGYAKAEILVDGKSALHWIRNSHTGMQTMTPTEDGWHDLDIRLDAGEYPGPGQQWNGEHALGWNTNLTVTTSISFSSPGWNWFALEGTDDEPMSDFRCRTRETFASVVSAVATPDGFDVTVETTGGVGADVAVFFGASAGDADSPEGWASATAPVAVPAGGTATLAVPWTDSSSAPWFAVRATGFRAGAFEQWIGPVRAVPEPAASIAVSSVSYTNATLFVSFPFAGVGATAGRGAVQVCRNESFAEGVLVFDAGVLAGGATVDVPATGLSTGATYFARAVVSNDAGETTASGSVSFATKIPGAPAGAAFLSERGFTTLSASAKATRFGTGSERATLRLEASEDPAFSDLAAVSETDAGTDGFRELTVSGLRGSATYHLRVRIVNEWGVAADLPLGVVSTRDVPVDALGVGHSFSPDGSTLDVTFDVMEVFDGAACTATLFYGGEEIGTRGFDAPGTLSWTGIPASSAAAEAVVAVAVADGTTTEATWSETVEPGSSAVLVRDVLDHASVATALRLRPGDVAILPEVRGPAGAGYEVLNPRFASLDGTVMTAREPGVCGVRRIDADSHEDTLALLVLPEPIADGAVYVLRDSGDSSTVEWDDPSSWERIGSETNDSWPREPDDVAVLAFCRKDDYRYVDLSSDVSLGALYVGNVLDVRNSVYIRARSGSNPTLSFRRTDGGEALLESCPNTTENRVFSPIFRNVRVEFGSDAAIDGGWSGVSDDRNRGLGGLFSNYPVPATNAVPDGVTVTIRNIDGTSHFPSRDASIDFGVLEGGGTIWNRSAGCIRFPCSSPGFTGRLRDSGHNGISGYTRFQGPTFLRAELPGATAETVGYVAASAGRPLSGFTGVGTVVTGAGYPYGESWYGSTNWFAGAGLRLHGGTWYANQRGGSQPEDGIDADRKIGRRLDVGPGFALLEKRVGESVNWIEFDELGQTGRGTLLVNDPVVSSSAATGDSTNSVTILRGWREHAAGGEEDGVPSPCRSVVPWMAVSSSLTSNGSGVFSFASFDEESRLVRPAAEAVPLADATPGANVLADRKALLLSADATVNSLVLWNATSWYTDTTKIVGEGRTLTVSSGGVFLGGTEASGSVIGLPGDSRNGTVVLGGAERPAYVWACGGTGGTPNQIWSEVKAPGGFVSAFTGCLLLGGDQTGIAGEIAVNAGTLVLGTDDEACVLESGVPVRIFANAAVRLVRADTLAGNEILFDGAAGSFGRVELPDGLLARCAGVRVRDDPESPGWTALPDGLYTGDAGVAARLCCAFVPDLLSGEGVLCVGPSTPVPEKTWTTPVPVPHEWLDGFSEGLAGSGGDYEAFGNAAAANGENDVWQCYVAGLDPTSPTNRFLATIEMTDGRPEVKWTPDLNEGGRKAVRVYTVEGSPTPAQGPWTAPDADSRFFRVRVALPE